METKKIICILIALEVIQISETCATFFLPHLNVYDRNPIEFFLYFQTSMPHAPLAITFLTGIAVRSSYVLTECDWRTGEG